MGWSDVDSAEFLAGHRIVDTHLSIPLAAHDQLAGRAISDRIKTVHRASRDVDDESRTHVPSRRRLLHRSASLSEDQ